MSKAIEQFIAIVGVHFPVPKFPDAVVERAWVASMTRTLRPYPHEVLAEAADEILRTRTDKDGRWFPKPAECTRVCERIMARRHAEATPLLGVDKAPPVYSQERNALALALMRTGLGLEAAREGWHGPLYSFVYANCRLPRADEVGALRALAAGFEDDVAACESGKKGDQSPALAKLGRSMVDEHARLRETILGGGAACRTGLRNASSA